jgi:SHS2 domain-containing protein
VIDLAERRFWREFDHTGDAGIQVHARTRGDLFAHAAVAMAQIMVETRKVRAIERRRIEVRADSDADLMHDLLAAALNLFLAESFIWCEASVLEEMPNDLAIELVGEKFDPRRHQLLTEIKAVTYHELKVGQTGAQWTARIVFDV